MLNDTTDIHIHQKKFCLKIFNLQGESKINVICGAGVALHPDWGNIWPGCNTKMT